MAPKAQLNPTDKSGIWETEIKNAKDFPNADFKESLVEKQNVLNFYKTELSGVKNYFNQKIESEFDTFNLQLILLYK